MAAQFHFHWGSTNSKGSEHTINSKQYPMEVTLLGVSLNAEIVSILKENSFPRGGD